MLILAIDFDGVIHDKAHPVPGRRMGPPMLQAKESLVLLKSQGHKIIVFSVWASVTKPIEDWMNYFQIPFDEITNVKPNADFFIDDKAIHFLDWATTLPQIHV